MKKVLLITGSFGNGHLQVSKNIKETFDNVDFFFKGMGNSMGIVILLIALLVFVPFVFVAAQIVKWVFS